MKVGILPRRSGSVRSLTGRLVCWNNASGKTDRHKSIVETSRGQTVLIQFGSEILVHVQASSNLDEGLREIGVDAPVADLIGIG